MSESCRSRRDERYEAFNNPPLLKTKPSVSGFVLKRRSSAMSEFSPLGGNDVYGACSDDVSRETFNPRFPPNNNSKR